MAHHRAFGLRAPETKCKARPQAWGRPSLCRRQVESGLDVRTHPFAPYSRQRPGETPVRTALSPRLLIRMRPEVQVLPGPPPALTSGDASQRCWSPLERAYTGPRTLTWLPFLVIDVLLPAFAPARFACHPVVRNGSSGLSTIRLVGFASPTHAGHSPAGRSGAPSWRRRRPLCLRAAGRTQTCPAGPTAGEYGEGAR